MTQMAYRIHRDFCQQRRVQNREEYNKSHVLTRNTIERNCCVLHNLCIRLEDPEPPADPQIEALVRQLELENEDATLSFETRPRCPAGFAKRNVIVKNFFSN
ncbi:nuclease HARBI1 [Trichonephila clavipes]|nr:nuclease HARBI1 [Trichonephila clavipes]